MLKLWQFGTFDPLQQLRCGNKRHCTAVIQPVLYSRFHKSLKQGSCYRPHLEYSKQAEIELRTARHKNKHPVSPADAMLTQHISETVGPLLQI
ncbi:hypothetical protein D3C75_529650 [compost metagenome]